MPWHGILEVEFFDVSGMDFIGYFAPSNQNQYMILMVHYVSKWVEAVAFPTNDVKVVIKFLKNMFTRFRTLRAIIITDEGSHLCNQTFETLLAKYGVKHKITTTYHTQTSGQAEILKKKSKQFWKR